MEKEVVILTEKNKNVSSLKNVSIVSSRPAFANYIFRDRLIISTYEQDPTDDSIRHGSFQLFTTDTLKSFKVEKNFQTEGGVFRFEVLPDNRILAALTSGKILIVQLDENSLKIQKENSNKISDKMLLHATLNSESGLILTSDNFGHIFILNSEDLSINRNWIGHSIKYSMVGFLILFIYHY